MTMRKDRVPPKKARKPAALIIAEARLATLEGDVSEIKKLLWRVAFGVIGALLTTVGTLAVSLLRWPLAAH
ncbi:hypothetical protein SAMN02745126_04011 [Enhydrobacter aerosaccus]|uniref:Uncharacterized protein n=1 Tax=Enhydrobacter aerosaccus TaxID=225324 RepID=A0A1T4RPR4_9HYPH|nr:hypothetical protein [Enhydrobacter aerosaccus]SKA17867.1 hypothetical protein SAMN02745126_04011 [Enhydrobacter aerosaccus]